MPLIKLLTKELDIIRACDWRIISSYFHMRNATRNNIDMYLPSQAESHRAGIESLVRFKAHRCCCCWTAPPGNQTERSSRCLANGWCRRGKATYSGPRTRPRGEFLEGGNKRKGIQHGISLRRSFEERFFLHFFVIFFTITLIGQKLLIIFLQRLP